MSMCTTNSSFLLIDGIVIIDLNVFMYCVEIILKWILEIGLEDVDWIHFTHNMNQW